MNINNNKFTKAWRLLKTWPLFVVFGMVSCVDVVQERVNGGGANFYGSDEVEMLPANLNLALDDSGFFLAGASTITGIAGKIIGCTSGVERDVEAQEPTLQSDGSVSLTFDVGTGDSDCFFAITELSVDGTKYVVDASQTSDPSQWSNDSDVEASSGESSAIIKVVNNIDDDEDPETGAYSDRTDVDATFTVITKFVGSSVSASFKSDAGSSSSATNVPNFGITANTDGTTADSFSLGRIREDSATQATFYLLNLQLECPTELTGAGAKTCDGVTIDGALDHSDSKTASEGDLLWRFALRNAKTTSSSESLANLYALSGLNAQWVALNEAADGGVNPDIENPGYKDKDGNDGCLDSGGAGAAGGGSNRKACIRDASDDDNGGFNLGLESSDFSPADAGNPSLTLVVELTKITDVGSDRTQMDMSGADVNYTAIQDLAYFMLDIDLIIE